MLADLKQGAYDRLQFYGAKSLNQNQKLIANGFATGRLRRKHVRCAVAGLAFLPPPSPPADFYLADDLLRQMFKLGRWAMVATKCIGALLSFR